MVGMFPATRGGLSFDAGDGAHYDQVDARAEVWPVLVWRGLAWVAGFGVPTPSNETDKREQH